MSKRKNRTGISNIFDDQGTEATPLLRTARPRKQRGVSGSSSYNLYQITPDPNQPRKLIPSALMDELQTGALTHEELLTKLKKVNPLGHAKIVELAQSVKTKGLIQPIRIQNLPDGMSDDPEIQYMIVVGERRWWAHVYLASQGESAKGTPLGRIRAELLVDTDSIRSLQWAENYDREDVSAVEKALAIQAVKTELASLGKTKWMDLERELGISKTLRHRLLSVLDLPEEAKQLVIENELPERALRPIVVKLRDQPNNQLLAVKHLINIRNIDSNDGSDAKSQPLDMFIEELLSQEPPKKVTTKRIRSSAQAKTLADWRKESKSTIKWLNKMSKLDPDQLTERQREKIKAEVEEIEKLAKILQDQLT